MRAAVVALALALAGCGGDDEPAPAEAPAPLSAQTKALAERCGFPAPQDGAAIDVPDGLLPSDAAVIRADGGRAVVLLRGTVNDSYRALLANAQRLEIVFQEVETFDAELEVKSDGGVTRFALTAAKCRAVTRAVVTTRPG